MRFPMLKDIVEFMKWIKIHNTFSLCKKWKHIVKRNSTIKPTQSFDYYFYLCFAFYSRLLRNGYWRIVFHYISNGQDECIVPLVVNSKRKQIRSLSYYGRLDYDDIISSNNSAVFVKEVIAQICNIYPQYTLVWKNINEHSILYPVLKNITQVQSPCVSIPLPVSYDEYYSSLSKHQRQNLRTAYNRLKTDNLDISFKIFDKSAQISKSLWNKCERIYEERHNMVTSSKFKQMWDRITNPYHHIMMKHPQRKIFVLFANNSPIAYMAGLYDEKQKAYYVPRLCINDEYGRYSPGIILVNETAKYLIEQGATLLDLMEGDEKYKLAMGGSVATNYKVQATTTELLEYVYSTKD